VIESANPRATRATLPWTWAVIGLVFLVVAAAIALVRLRVSPVYPAFNDVNSDVYVYQLVGNSWRYGLLPYRDVYDVKGPLLYLLFGLFAWVRPWSMGPPLVFLVGLALLSLWLAYAIARLHGCGRWLSMLAAVATCGLIYLGVMNVVTSVSCEEIAVPGVLLLLWLTLRWLRDEPVAAGWWVLSGVAAGALFWAKYQVVAPWVAMLVGLTVLGIRGRLSGRRLGRVVALHLVGVAAATDAILTAYAPVLPDLLRAYFLAKRGVIDVAGELPAEVRFAGTLAVENPGPVLVLVGVLALLVVRARRDGREGLVLVVAFVLSAWAAAAVVRHQNNLFPLLAYAAVAVPQLLAQPKPGRRLAAAAVAVVALGAVAGPLVQSVNRFGLLRPPPPPTCVDPATGAATTPRGNPSQAFAAAAGDQLILSVGTLYAARSAFVSRQPVRHPFTFVDASWARTVGANRVQTRYLQQRTFRYIWIEVAGLDPRRDLSGQIARSASRTNRIEPGQAAALVRQYTPVLGCNRQLLLRAR
jgi:hypothetical protein